VPLILLGSLAVLLLVAGSAGYLLRRFRNSGSEPPTA
jgi:MprA protease rhombosortase-interaction domain-containing protein